MSLFLHALLLKTCHSDLGYPHGSEVKIPLGNVGNKGLILGSEGSSWEGNGNPLQYSFLGNLTDRGVWRATVHVVVVIESLNYVWFFATPWTAAHQASLFFTISWSLLKFISTESVMLSNHVILCHPLLLPSIFPSIRIFSNELALCIKWQSTGLQLQHQSFQWICRFSPLGNQSFQWIGLIQGLMLHIHWKDWFPLGLTFDLLALQETLRVHGVVRESGLSN